MTAEEARVRQQVAAERQAQGLPPTICDPVALADLAAILRDYRGNRGKP